MRSHRVGSVAAVIVLAGGLVVPSSSHPTMAASLSGWNAAAVLSRMTEAQRVGQLIMVSASLSGVSSATTSAITNYHVGSVILTGRTTAGVAAVRAMTRSLQALATTSATGGVPLFVAADQEGGYVQALQGPGYSRIPTALTQGTYPTATLTSNSITWGRQLASSGVNLDLAPVLDTVPPNLTATNQPIGRYQREFGTDPSTVTRAGAAFIQGMHTAGVEVTVKHFPGLGRASGNTDTTFGVVDTTTTRYDPYIAPFASGSGRAGAAVVMVSLATYTRIDSTHRAVFSPTILNGMLRGDLQFTGVIMSDSMDAAAVRDLTPGQRAVGFVAAGGDLVLTTQPADVPAMASALLSRAAADPAFRARIDASCVRVLEAKQRAGIAAGGFAVAAGGGRLYVAEQTSSHTVDVYVRTGSTWSGPVALGGTPIYPPALARISTIGVEVAEVTPRHEVGVRNYLPGGRSSGWVDLHGTATSAPGLGWSPPGRATVAVRGADLALWLREYRPGLGWGGWTSLGGALGNAAPAVVYERSGDLDIFAIGQTQGVYRNVRHNGVWSGWRSWGGPVEAAVASTVTPATGVVTVLATGIHATLSARTPAVAWSAVPGGRSVLAPGAAPTATTVISAVVEGLDGRLHIATHSPSGWSGWSLLPFG